MESHPLNLAHQQHRRADAHLINNRYDEAMQCHHNAAELLLDAMKSTTSSAALESISLQHSYHLKQKDLIKSKKEQYARVKKAMENIKLLSRDPHLKLQSNEYSKLQIAIYRAINESEALLHKMSNEDLSTESRLLQDPVYSGDVTDGKKIEKSQQTIVEELQILSQNLHSLVEQLVLQVEVLKDENVTLKERVSYLEKERVKYLNLPSSYSNSEQSNFSTIFVPKDELNVATNSNDSTELNQKINALVLERTNQQPHFDLSAFKDQ
ncbi:nuclear receptor-binding factor 2 [Papilio machaon]|uniref:nuclear receptor-binding factor 2 n=1 Tax=Papilio machaon TaxID=76193 RepID=UPI001E66541B|nr:nuclear receptor-binding factor 2 [Papilio machaon]